MTQAKSARQSWRALRRFIVVKRKQWGDVATMVRAYARMVRALTLPAKSDVENGGGEEQRGSGWFGNGGEEDVVLQVLDARIAAG
jgi:hypothetical protein